MSGGPSQAFIPPVRLDNADVWQAVLPRLEELVRSGQFILGTAVQEFETEAEVTAYAYHW